jgi:hypothetical protein
MGELCAQPQYWAVPQLKALVCYALQASHHSGNALQSSMGPMRPGIPCKLLAIAIAVATAMRRYRSTNSACSTQVTAFGLHWIPVQRAMSMKFSPPMTLLARRAIRVVAAAAAGTFLATVTSTRCSRPYTNCMQTVQISSKQPARPYTNCIQTAQGSSQPASLAHRKECESLQTSSFQVLYQCPSYRNIQTKEDALVLGMVGSTCSRHSLYCLLQLTAKGRVLASRTWTYASAQDSDRLTAMYAAPGNGCWRRCP